MMLYTFYLVILLAATPHCALWSASAPDAASLAAACGTADLTPYELVLYDITSGREVCRPVDPVTLAPCNLMERSRDMFRLVAYTPARAELACAVTLSHDRPARADWESACPPWALAAYDAGNYEISLAKTEPAPIPAPLCPRVEIAPGPGLYEQPASAAELASAEPLSLLAGRLIWHGVVVATCPGGFAGVDATTLSANGCGMDAAKMEVINYQNRFDGQLYDAALAENVPARLLKWLLIRESQTWTVQGYGPAGEVGAFQVTDAGFDTLLRYTDPGYGGAHPERQFYARAALRDRLACPGCGLAQADAHLRDTMGEYARLLAAYRCQSGGGWPEAVRAWNQMHEVE